MLQSEGMYVLFPDESNPYYYFLRIFEDGASGKMIQSNYEFEEIYLSVYHELENKRYFMIDRIGNNILLTSNLIFDLKGKVYENKLRLMGYFKDGRPWLNEKVNDYYYIPLTFVDDPRKVWILSHEKQPISIELKDRGVYLHKEIHEPISYENLKMKDLIIENNEVVGYFQDLKAIFIDKKYSI